MIVPIDGNGIVLDPHIDWTLETVAATANVSDVFLYSHGWSTDAEHAMMDYSYFTAGFMKNLVDGRGTRPPRWRFRRPRGSLAYIGPRCSARTKTAC